MNRLDYLFVIGYSEDIAVVDLQSKKRYGKLSTAELLEKGLLKAAFCSADFADSEQEFCIVQSSLKNLTGRNYSLNEMRKLFGVFGIPAGIKRTILV
jgi:hypothetical protein